MLKKARQSPLLCILLPLLLLSLLIIGCGSNGPETTKVLSSTTTPPQKAVENTTEIKNTHPKSEITPVTLTTPTTGSEPNIQIIWTDPTTMYTIGLANVRNAPSTDGTILKSFTGSTAITVYGSAQGEVVNGLSTWYRISDRNDAPQYIFGNLLSTTKAAPTPTPPPTQNNLPLVGAPGPAPAAPPAPVATGKSIYVNLSTQYLYAYENGALVRSFPIASGRPELYTPAGTFKVLDKGANLTFYSPWPASSPYYYSPEHVDYALHLTTGASTYILLDGANTMTLGQGHRTRIAYLMEPSRMAHMAVSIPGFLTGNGITPGPRLG
ncbi:hypothetical protein KSX_28450 [Ktedonospora formicarum]|uniref:L,D-TPase catalytic domain-containing protein n=1 Tax=Ktedonospora formicarum TaxID=2778364 RepID=A0A8J3MQA0_9CHLR|nr:L,D-transpeptidase family protein [Ktedonospora formicarum]GHO44682.1 hypothetical protein KSX_28450 [Ktedonospora formicarum]